MASPLKFCCAENYKELRGMNALRASVNWLKFVWATQPVLFISVVFGGIGEWLKEGLSLVCNI